MSTTQLFVELLVIGVGGIIWLSLFIAAVFNGSLKNCDFFSNPVLILMISGLAYVLGIITDRLARGVFHRFEKKIEEKVNKKNLNEKEGVESNPGKSAEDKEIYIISHSDKLIEKINYNRSRLRICRSWVINFLFITLALISFELSKQVLSCECFWSFLVVILLLAFLTYSFWYKLTEDHFKQLNKSYDFSLKQSQKNKEGG